MRKTGVVAQLGFLVSALALPATARAQTPQTTDAGNPPSRVARISALAGTVSLQPSGWTQWSEGTLNYTVTTGDRLYAGAGGRAEMEVGALAIRMGDNTDLTMTNLTDHLVQIGLNGGLTRLSIFRWTPGDSIEVDTPNGAATVLSPGEYRFDVEAATGMTIVSVDRGSVQLSGPDLDQTIQGGQAVSLSGSNPIQVASIPRPRATALDDWSAARDHRLTASDCVRYVSPDVPGCADLSENGRWATVAEYGPVWYPSTVAVGWVPYRYGRWVWEYPWGWVWVEDEPWGFAPFHYGRWAYIGTSWGWVPGPLGPRPFYAPALVAFVGGPGFGVGINVGFQAWIPLGPREPYYPWYHSSEGYLRDVNARNVRNVTNIQTFVHDTNVTQIQYVNRTRAITAVPAPIFQGGRPVAPANVHLQPDQLNRAQFISHPTVSPLEPAALGGRPATHPPVVGPRPQMVTVARTGRGQAAPAATPAASAPRTAQAAPGRQTGAGQPTAPPLVRRAPPPAPGTATAAAPPSTAAEPGRSGTRSAQPGRGPAQSAQPAPRTLITRAAAPPQNLPFPTQAQVMQSNPGRPPEPQQIQNVRAGRPAGPQRDPEVGPRGAAPPAAAPPAGRGAPPAAPARGGGAAPTKPPTGRGGGGRS